jgi:hypothetical protein
MYYKMYNGYQEQEVHMTFKKAILALVLISALFIFCSKAPAVTLTIITTGDWEATIDRNSVPGGAGSDTVETESSSSEKLFLIRQTNGNWRMDVSFGNTSSWDSRLKLYVKRTGSGIFGTVSGGTTYIEVSSASRSFFTGTGNVWLIPIQYKIGGGLAASGISADTYTLEVVFTITDGL